MSGVFQVRGMNISEVVKGLQSSTGGKFQLDGERRGGPWGGGEFRFDGDKNGGLWGDGSRGQRSGGSDSYRAAVILNGPSSVWPCYLT